MSDFNHSYYQNNTQNQLNNQNRAHLLVDNETYPSNSNNLNNQRTNSENLLNYKSDCSVSQHNESIDNDTEYEGEFIINSESEHENNLSEEHSLYKSGSTQLTSDNSSDEDYLPDTKKKNKFKKRTRNNTANKQTSFKEGENSSEDEFKSYSSSSYASDWKDSDKKNKEKKKIKQAKKANKKAREVINNIEDKKYQEEDTIESVHDFRINSEIDKELEYLLKWKNWSHLYNTWETFINSRNYLGWKKIVNYKKKIVDLYFKMKEDSSYMYEDIQAFEYQLQNSRRMLEDYKKVERIIAHNSVEKNEDCPSGIEYFCKWYRLPYSSCTWEPYDIIKDNNQGVVDDYIERLKLKTAPNKGIKYPKNKPRPQYKKLIEQPSYIEGGILRDYQLTGLNWMSYLWSKNENGILADEMGLGKTIQTVSFISFLFHQYYLFGPYLVVVPLSTIDAWQETFKKWAPDIDVVCYIGDKESRALIRKYEFNNKDPKFNVLLTSYEMTDIRSYLEDRLEWSLLVIDEAHRLKNITSTFYKQLSKIDVVNKLLITGTPLQNSVKELCSLINFLMQEKFDLNLDEIDMSDNITEEERLKHEKIIEDLHQKLKPYFLRRLKDEVEKSLPKKTEKILRVQLSNMQVHYYKNIFSKNYDILKKLSNSDTSSKGHVSLLNITMELRKACNHPFLFANAEYNYFKSRNYDTNNREHVLNALIKNSGKMVLLDKLLTKLKHSGNRVLLFSQIKQILDIISDYLTLKGYMHQRLDGGTTNEDRKRCIQLFNEEDSPYFVFLLSTKAGGLGINLATADTVIIFDSDWNPQNDMQAIARAHRIGQKKPVSIYRFVSKDTIEEQILEKAKRKIILEYCIIRKMDANGNQIQDFNNKTINNDPNVEKHELLTMLKFGASNLFKKSDNSQEKLENLDLDDILNKAEELENINQTGSISQGGEEFLKQFEVADFHHKIEDDWESIIPEHERNKSMDYSEQNILKRATKNQKVNYVEDEETVETVKGKNIIAEKKMNDLIKALFCFGLNIHKIEEIKKESGLYDLNSQTIKKYIEQIKSILENKIKESSDKKFSIKFKGRTITKAHDLYYKSKIMDTIHFYVSKLKKPSDFELPFFPVHFPRWSCEDWNIREDAMLLVGIYKYGFGNWSSIQKDPELGLSDKIYVGTKNNLSLSPKGSHLSKRCEYLFKNLLNINQTSKNKSIKDKTKSTKDVPQNLRQATKMLRPVKVELRMLRDLPDTLENNKEKVDLIKSCLAKIGKFIEDKTKEMQLKKGEEAKIQDLLWTSVASFWPSEVESSQIIELYRKL